MDKSTETQVEKELQKRPNYATIKENTGAYTSAKEEVIVKLIADEYFGGYK